MNDPSSSHVDHPYADNAAFLDDLRRFVETLIAQSRGAPADSIIGSPNEGSFAWRAIAARMAATVRSEIFIPFAHMALVFQLDARELQLLSLALLIEADRSIADAYTALTNELDEFGAGEDNGQLAENPPVGIALRTAAHLLGDIRPSLFTDSPLLFSQLIEFVDFNVSNLSGSYRLARPITPYLLGLAAPQARIGDHLAVDVPAEASLDDLIVDLDSKRQLLRFAEICSTSAPRLGSSVLHIEADDTALAGALAAFAFSKLGYGVAQFDARHIRLAYQNDNQRLAPLMQQLRIACRDAALCTQVIMLTDSEALVGNDERDETDVFDSVLQTLVEITPYCVVVNGPVRRLVDVVARQRRQSSRLFPIRVAPTTPDLRRRAWEKYASFYDLPLDDRLMTAVAGAYAFTEARIAAVATILTGRYALSGEDGIDSLVWDACRAEAEDQPIGVAKRVDTSYRLDDLVAPQRTLELLHETLGQVRYRPKVIDEWGFAAKYSNVANLCVLFHGPPGTGKTMASSIVANELSLPLYRVDLSTVLSKYIGETERNIAQLFDRAESMNVVLLFDEAEGLFSKRTESKDSHDRFANLQVGYLLQRIETYPGLVILSTNLVSNMDKAFLRRFRFVIEFPFPTSEERLRLWRQIFPAQVRLDTSVDFGLLAEKASLSGGHIRNAAISAAFLAARDGTGVTMTHLVKSVGHEYEKLGKLFSKEDY